MTVKITEKQLAAKFTERLNQLAAAKIIDDTGCDTMGQYFHIEYSQEDGEIRIDQHGHMVCLAKASHEGFKDFKITDPDIHVMDLIEATCDVLNVGPTMLDMYGVKQRWFTTQGKGALGLNGLSF